MAAQRHYWDYKIADGQGNVDGRLGIKLPETEVQVLEAFERPQTTTIPEDLGHKVHLRVFHDDRVHLASIQSQFDLNCRADAFHFILELAQSLLTAAEFMNLTPEQLTSKLIDLVSESKLSDLEMENSPLNRDGDSEQRSTSEHLSVELSNKDENIEDSSAQLDLDQTNAVDSSAQNPHLKTEELSSVDRQTAPQSQALFDRMDRQQQSLSSLTDAIHGLVQVLASSNSNSSTNHLQHSETEAKSDRDRSSDLVSSPAKYTPKPQSPSSTKTSSLTKSSDTSTTSATSHRSESTSDTISPRKRRSELSRQKVNRYIDAIMAYNDVLNRPHPDKWLITIAALKRLTHCGQSVIYDVLNSRAEDLQFHHHKHQLGQYHNQKGKNSPKIESLISLV